MLLEVSVEVDIFIGKEVSGLRKSIIDCRYNAVVLVSSLVELLKIRECQWRWRLFDFWFLLVARSVVIRSILGFGAKRSSVKPVPKVLVLSKLRIKQSLTV